MFRQQQKLSTWIRNRDIKRPFLKMATIKVKGQI